MTQAPDRSALLPAAGAGIALLVFGALLLLAGDAFAQDPSALEFWIVGVGVLVLLGAVLLILVRSTPEAPSAPVADRRPAVAEAPPGTSANASAPPASATPSESEESWSDPRERRPAASSIPAQYIRLLPETVSWAEVPRPVIWDEGESVSLPFSAGPRGVLGDLPPLPVFLDTPPPSVGELEIEVERLRERVHELEAGDVAYPFGASVPIRPSLQVSGSPSEPPRPSSGPLRRACVGCGSGLPGGATDPLCWGCGRPLCATCYWRTKDGAAAHTCPSCFARADGMSRSGARGKAPDAVSVTRPAPSPRPAATATARR